MKEQNVDLLVNDADHLLQLAEAELQRSEEDVTAYLVCHNSRQSITNYLAAYLLKNGVEPNEPATMASLIQQCREMDGRFDLIDISQIACRHEEEDESYCLNIDKVSHCLGVARQTRGIAINESPAY